jgi:hypothetical protein
MRRLIQGHAASVLAMLLVLLLFGAPAPTACAQGEADYREFYEALEPHGRWFEHRRWGYVWAPRVAQEDWRPYSRGHWVQTEEHGWFWVSDEEFGWATYHYGRWLFDEDYGWIWVPGSEWGPAWVVWRHSDDYIGWAPLPPEAVWEPARGLRFHADHYDAPRYAAVWCFVHPRFMVMPGIYRYMVPHARNLVIVRRTRPMVAYAFADRRIVNHGIDVRLVERAAQRPIVPVRIRLTDTPHGHGSRKGDRTFVSIYRPSLRAHIGAPVRPRLHQADEIRASHRPAAFGSKPVRPNALEGSAIVPGQNPKPHVTPPSRAAAPRTPIGPATEPTGERTRKGPASTGHLMANPKTGVSPGEGRILPEQPGRLDRAPAGIHKAGSPGAIKPQTARTGPPEGAAAKRDGGLAAGRTPDGQPRSKHPDKPADPYAIGPLR